MVSSCRASASPAWACPDVDEALAARLGRDHGVHPYAKWRGAFWRLLSLVELGAGRDQPGVLDAAEQTLTWLAAPRRLAEPHGIAVTDLDLHDLDLVGGLPGDPERLGERQPDDMGGNLHRHTLNTRFRDAIELRSGPEEVAGAAVD